MVVLDGHAHTRWSVELGPTLQVESIVPGGQAATKIELCTKPAVSGWRVYVPPGIGGGRGGDDEGDGCGGGGGAAPQPLGQAHWVVTVISYSFCVVSP